MNTKHFAGRSELSLIAAQAMVERGLEPDFPIRALHEVQAMTHAGDDADPRVVDLTALAWCSIDNDDSRDLDQLTVAESLPNGDTQIYVAVADVDVLVPKGSALDAHAQHNTASVYTSTRVFPMLPERWQRIVALAATYGEHLPAQPDSAALEMFLAKRHIADPVRFVDLSLVIVKLMGSGEYVVEHPKSEAIGHFGLSVRDYTHSTAPNRRYPDLVTQRMLKSLLMQAPAPYSSAELEALALHCTRQEDAARKVERRMRKSEAALMLTGYIGHVFEAVVTGKTPSGTWVRVFSPPVEGMLTSYTHDHEVGEFLRVKLTHTNVEQGFIDFATVR